MRKSVPAVLVAAAIAATAAGTAVILPKAAPATPAKAASAAVAPAQRPESRPTPAPHILGFAQGLTASPRKLPAAPGPVPQAPGSDGCDHDYGTVAQCVPWTFPPGVDDSTQARCAWLGAHGYAALRVHGRDRLHLDRNRDGIACGRGD